MWVWGLTVFVIVLMFRHAGPIIDRQNSARQFCNAVLAAMDEGEQAYFYDRYRQNVHFHMHQIMPVLKQSTARVGTELEDSNRLVLILQTVSDSSLDKTVLDLGLDVEQVAHAHIGSREFRCVIVGPTAALSEKAPSNFAIEGGD